MLYPQLLFYFIKKLNNPVIPPFPSRNSIRAQMKTKVKRIFFTKSAILPTIAQKMRIPVTPSPENHVMKDEIKLFQSTDAAHD